METQSQHTPGPWTVTPFEYWDKDIVIYEPRVKVDNDDVDQEEAKANAILIAAAPDMLEALRGAMRYDWTAEDWEHAENAPAGSIACEISMQDILAFRAAIAKATQP